jgi:ISXO2-like transposase domain
VLLECTNCGLQRSVISGTIFENTRTPLTTWFRAMWWLIQQKEGASALRLQQEFGLKSYETAWIWLHKLRHAMTNSSHDRLSGLVEVDSCYVDLPGPNRRSRTRSAQGAIMIASENDRGRIRAQRLTGDPVPGLEDFIARVVLPGSSVIVNGPVTGSRLHQMGYRGKSLNPVRGGEHLSPRTRKAFEALGQWLKASRRGAVSEKHLGYYIDEFVFRFNGSMLGEGALFAQLVQGAVASNPLPYDAVVHSETVAGRAGDVPY